LPVVSIGNTNPKTKKAYIDNIILPPVLTKFLQHCSDYEEEEEVIM